MAAMCVGGVGVWLFQDSLIDEVQYIIDHADAKLMVGEGQEEVDKCLMIKDKCPKLKKMIWIFFTKPKNPFFVRKSQKRKQDA
jgi:long-chain acyl-CoA synthetase